MARVDPDSLADAERVFIAASLTEALRVENLLTLSGVDYAVHVEIFSTSLFGSPRNGAAFYVAAGQAAYCRSHLRAAGLGRGVVEDPPA